MKLILPIVLSLLISAGAYAQSNSADTVKRKVLILDDGTKLKGKVIKENAEEVTFKDDNLGESYLQAKNKITGIRIWR